MADNICVSKESELLYVTKDEIKRTCVGFGNPKEVCGNKMVCVGFSSGKQSYGWPKQIIQALSVSLNHGKSGFTDFSHPQCLRN